MYELFTAYIRRAPNSLQYRTQSVGQFTCPLQIFILTPCDDMGVRSWLAHSCHCFITLLLVIELMLTSIKRSCTLIV